MGEGAFCLATPQAEWDLACAHYTPVGDSSVSSGAQTSGGHPGWAAGVRWAGTVPGMGGVMGEAEAALALSSAPGTASREP